MFRTDAMALMDVMVRLNAVRNKVGESLVFARNTLCHRHAHACHDSVYFFISVLLNSKNPRIGMHPVLFPGLQKEDAMLQSYVWAGWHRICVALGPADFER